MVSCLLLIRTLSLSEASRVLDFSLMCKKGYNLFDFLYAKFIKGYISGHHSSNSFSLNL